MTRYMQKRAAWTPNERALMGAGIGGLSALVLSRLFGGKRRNLVPWLLGGIAAGGAGGYNWDSIKNWWKSIYPAANANKTKQPNTILQPAVTAPTAAAGVTSTTKGTPKKPGNPVQAKPMVNIPEPPKYVPDPTNKVLPRPIRKQVVALEKQRAKDNLEAFNTSSQGVGRTHALDQAQKDLNLRLNDLNYQIKAFEQKAPELILSGKMSKQQVASTLKALNDQRLNLIRFDTKKSFLDNQAKMHYNKYINSEAQEAAKRRAHMANMNALQAMPVNENFNRAREQAKEYIDGVLEAPSFSARLPKDVPADYDNAVNSFAHYIMNNGNVTSVENVPYTLPLIGKLLYPDNTIDWTGSALPNILSSNVARDKALDRLNARNSGETYRSYEPQIPDFTY